MEDKKTPAGGGPEPGQGQENYQLKNSTDSGTGCQSIYPLSLDENTRKKRRVWKWTELNRRRARLKTDVQAYVGKKLRQAITFDEGGAI